MNDGMISSHARRRRREPEDVGDNPDASQCCFYLERKHRFCRMERREGSRFCATHHCQQSGSVKGEVGSDGNNNNNNNNNNKAIEEIHENGVALAGIEGNDIATEALTLSSKEDRKNWERVPCLINPNHTVYVCRLAKHMRVCPDLRYVTYNFPYYSKDRHAFRNTTNRGDGRGWGGGSSTSLSVPPTASEATTLRCRPPTAPHTAEEKDNDKIVEKMEKKIFVDSQEVGPAGTPLVHTGGEGGITSTSSSYSSTKATIKPPSSLAQPTSTAAHDAEEGKTGNLTEENSTAHKKLHPDHLTQLIERVRQCYENYVKPSIFLYLPEACANKCSNVSDALATNSVKHRTSAFNATILTQNEAREMNGGKRKEEEGREAEENAVAGTSMMYIHKIAEQIGEEGSIKHTPQHIGLLKILDFAIMKSGLPSLHKPIHGVMEVGAGKGGLAIALQRLLTTYVKEVENLSLCSSLSSSDASLLSTHFPFLSHQWKTSQGARRSSSTTTASSFSSFYPHITVIDRQTFRRKGDSKVCRSALPIKRLRVDLKDLYLTQAFLCGAVTGNEKETESRISASRKEEEAEEKGKDAPEERQLEWVAVGKHLCGAATEFALSCLSEPELGTTAHISIRSLTIATCCHHRCAFAHMLPLTTPSSSLSSSTMPHDEPVRLSLPGTNFSLNEHEFAAVASMTSWAVSGATVEPKKRHIGYICKRIIDSYRVAYLRCLGFEAYLATYIPSAITEENVCIVAFR